MCIHVRINTGSTDVLIYIDSIYRCMEMTRKRERTDLSVYLHALQSQLSKSRVTSKLNTGRQLIVSSLHGWG